MPKKDARTTMKTIKDVAPKQCKHEWREITDSNSTGIAKCIHCDKILYDKDLYFNVYESYYGNI